MTHLPRLTAAEALQPDALARAGYLTEERAGARRGQVFIMFALFMTAMLGVLGLSIDVGYSVSQRRMMQNAADLAAISGALAIANYHQDNQISSLTSVQQTIDGNQTHEGSPALEECRYMDDSLAEIAACDGFVPPGATGVSILVRETHQTFFIRVVPGAPTEVSTRARASARVERLFRAGMDGPFVVCGYGTRTTAGSSLSILSNDTSVNPNAVGQTYRLTGQSYAPNFYETGDNTGAEIADCGLNLAALQDMGSGYPGETATGGDDEEVENTDASYPDRGLRGWLVTFTGGTPENIGETRRIDDNDATTLEFDDDLPEDVNSGDTYTIQPDSANFGPARNARQWIGLAENQASSPNNNGKELNQNWLGRNRNGAGRIKFNITGLEGCQRGDRAPFNCVLLLPIATDGDHGGVAQPGLNQFANPRFLVVKVLAFKVSSCGSGCYQGTLLDDYPVFGGSVGGWCRDCGAVTVVKLKE